MTNKVNIGKKILSANEEYAQKNRDFFKNNNKSCINIISSPGSGKTTILTRTITDIQDKIKIAVIEGDIQTDLDAQRIKATNAPAIQVNTNGSCHLSAAQVTDAIEKLPADETELFIIENVGNLVCPSAFELGESAKVVVLSVAEGDDKPAKYPEIFAKSTAMLINKTDLLGAVDFDIERASRDAAVINKDIKIFPVSAKTGEGMQAWYEWLVNLQLTIDD